MRPVTVMADTEVNNAVRNGVTSPSVFAMGSSKKPVPTPASAMNPYTIAIGDATPRTGTVRRVRWIWTGAISAWRGRRTITSPGRGRQEGCKRYLKYSDIRRPDSPRVVAGRCYEGSLVCE